MAHQLVCGKERAASDGGRNGNSDAGIDDDLDPWTPAAALDADCACCGTLGARLVGVMNAM